MANASTWSDATAGGYDRHNTGFRTDPRVVDHRLVIENHFCARDLPRLSTGGRLGATAESSRKRRTCYIGRRDRDTKPAQLNRSEDQVRTITR